MNVLVFVLIILFYFQAFESSSSWTTDGGSSGRTVFEGSGAVYGHLFDSPTTLDIAVWCGTSSSSSFVSCATAVPPLSGPGAPTLTEPVFSEGMFSTTDLLSLQKSVDVDETIVVGVSGTPTASYPSRSASFGGAQTDYYNAIRNRWSGGVSDWMDEYYWKQDIDGVRQLRMEPASVSIPAWLSPFAPTSGTYNLGTSAAMYLLMAATDDGNGGWVVSDSSSSYSSTPLPDFVRDVFLQNDEAVAGFFALPNRSGCGMYDGTEYCLEGCSAYRNRPGVPFYLHTRWCGTSAVLFGWGSYRGMFFYFLMFLN
jgi:hypothetical protein